MGFIKSMHPKSSLSPTLQSIKFALEHGFIGQKKINGARCQIHIKNGKIVSLFTRKGSLHTVSMSEELKHLIATTFNTKNLTVLDAEWLRFNNRIYLFDVLKFDGKLLDSWTYLERYQILKDYKISSTMLYTLPLIKTANACLKIMECKDKICEGLVFKNAEGKGFKDLNIIRMRKED